MSMRPGSYSLILVLVGFAAGAATVGVPLAAKITRPAAPPPAAHLYRFDVQAGGEAPLARWVQFEKEHHAETLGTLQDESMYFEAVFSDDPVHPKYLYWIAMNGVSNPHATPKPIDDEFRSLEAVTLVKGSRRELPLQYQLIAPFLQSSIDAHHEHK